MFLIYGYRIARIKKYADNRHACPNCGAFDLDVRVYKGYFQLFLIPFFPAGMKTTSIYCNECWQRYPDGPLQEEYERITRVPLFLYSGIILVVALIIFLVFANLNKQKEKARFVDEPRIGDVYKMKKDEGKSKAYYFLRVSKIRGDTVSLYHNHLVYDRYVSKFNSDDFFVSGEQVGIIKDSLKRMLERGEINSVERDYGSKTGFNRIR